MATHLCGTPRTVRTADPGIEIPQQHITVHSSLRISPDPKKVAREIRKALTPIINSKWNYVSDRHRNRLIETEIVRILKSIP